MVLLSKFGLEALHLRTSYFKDQSHGVGKAEVMLGAPTPPALASEIGKNEYSVARWENTTRYSRLECL
jgi:hypothetical protein